MHQQLFKFLQAFLLLPLTILVAQLSVTIVVINELFRLCVSLWFWIKYRGKRILAKDGVDAVWQYRGKGNTRMILVPMILSQKAVLFEHSIAMELEKRLLTNGDLNSVYRKLKLVIFTFCGYVAFREVNDFNLRNHVRSLCQTKVYSNEEVTKVFSECYKDMDDSKPQWEIVIMRRFLDETDNLEKSLIIFRFHHSYMDGMSMLMMLNNLSDDYKYLINPLTTRKIPKWKMTMYYVNALTFGSKQLVQCLLNLFRRHWITNTTIPFGQKHFAWLRNQLKLESLQQIRSKSKASIPNILILAFVEACRQVLPTDRLVKNVSVGEVIAFLPYPNTKPQNRFTMYSYSADLSSECVTTLTLSERLTNLKDKAQDALLGPEPIVVFYLFELVGRLPSFVVPQILTATQQSLYLSNVPCSKDKFALFQGQCEAIGAFPPCFCDSGLLLAVVSYNNYLNVCVSADSSWLSEIELKSILSQIPTIIEELNKEQTSSKNELPKAIYDVTLLNGSAKTVNHSIKKNHKEINQVTSDSNFSAQFLKNYGNSQSNDNEV